ncbi:hypothetical protein SEA_XKCD426_73 [Streptomyces phage Xkcd426]|nr:hypothetical protein SEA_XKCD426_73 [Streptomyces phage Xkcd426]
MTPVAQQPENHTWRGCSAFVNGVQCGELRAHADDRCDAHSLRCAATVARTGQRCRAKRLYGSAYCMSHHRKHTNSV